MAWIPVFKIGLWNGWLFMIVFPLQWLAAAVLPGHLTERTGHAQGAIHNRKDRILSCLTQVVWIGATLYSVFLPLRTGSVWFWLGLGFFALGVTILVLASVNAVSTPPGAPFTSGIYRFSRHPMYLSMLIVYLGVTVASLSGVFALITVVTFFLQRHQAIREEGFCLETYGQRYRDYLNGTSRWFSL
jgi:protein-S-isoprenylcysteine O-methyltransferase Ste14